MSYFMTISGPRLDLRGPRFVELLPAMEAQGYLRDRAADLERLDGAPVHLVHDGSTGTSDEVVGEAWDRAAAGAPLEGTRLARLVALLDGRTLRIWYADDRPDAHLRVEECGSVEEMWEAFKAAAGRRTVALRLRLASSGADALHKR